jgi:hypothetical protein
MRCYTEIDKTIVSPPDLTRRALVYVYRLFWTLRTLRQCKAFVLDECTQSEALMLQHA